MACEDRFLNDYRPKIGCLLFDLDDTLYPLSSGLLTEILMNIGDYLVQKLGIEESKIPDMCDLLYKNYGTTMAELRIFTNVDRIHTTKVINRLGLKDCFEGIIYFETLNPSMEATRTNKFDIIEYSLLPVAGMELPEIPVLCKPSEYAIKQALDIAGIDPQNTVGTSHKVKGADHALKSIHNIKEAQSKLWEESKRSGDVLYSGKVAIETTVTA